MVDNHTNDTLPLPAAESGLREQLAAYFLSVAPYAALNETQQTAYRTKLQQLGELEQREILDAAGSHRPLTWGNPVPLIQNLLTAAQRLAAGAGQPLLLFPAKEVSIDFAAMLHPRLLSTAVSTLLRTACEAAPRQPVWVRLQEQDSCLTIAATAAETPTATPLFAVIQECARLHGGSLARCEKTSVFSISRTAEPTHTQRYLCPTAEELCRDTLSPLWTAFYAWLPLSSGENNNPSVETDTDSSEE